MKKLEILHAIPKMGLIHEVSECYWKNGTYQLAQYRVATNHQYIKNALSVTCSKQSAIRWGTLVYNISVPHQPHTGWDGDAFWKCELNLLPINNSQLIELRYLIILWIRC